MQPVRNVQRQREALVAHADEIRDAGALRDHPRQERRPGQQVRLPDVFVCAAMAGIDLDGAPVVPECEFILLQVTVRKTEDVLYVCVIGIAEFSAFEKAHRLGPVADVNHLPARGVVFVTRGEIGIRFVRIGRGDRGEGHDRRTQQHCANETAEPDHRCANVFAFTSSGRAVSASFASAASFW